MENYFIYGGVFQWHTQFLMIAFHVVLVQQSVRLALFLRATASTKSTLILASSAAHVQVFAL